MYCTIATKEQLGKVGYVYEGTNNDLPFFTFYGHSIKLKNGIVVQFDNEKPTDLNIKDECLKNYGIFNKFPIVTMLAIQKQLIKQ